MTLYHITFVNIDETHISSKDFQKEWNSLQKYLNISGMIDYLCLHEAAHLVYSRRENIETTRREPTIECLKIEGKDIFIHINGGVGHPDITRDTKYTSGLLFRLAIIGLAPNLLVDAFLSDLGANPLLAQKVREDKQVVYNNDFDEFKKRCKWAMRDGLKFMPEQYWRWAEQFLLEDFTVSQRLDEIKEAVDKIKPLFRAADLSSLLAQSDPL
jgi:hypothetical protein